ncbi:S41 family peptidase [Staphylococcus intermedius]|uniref:Probable CtpA-like serine protease n=1 Tax=Staphylococcus intermedius NCTC 11048 TaxID=1141106 RepID=A0A380G6L5_STAIN|nr:S41 family peptidase [Staphylococcus intermedius]PCF64923.1 serine protease [Staphylococcus intermedius]PCF80533.1 serine protease [Staphylococcus intermedius]PCF81883.1 serine protease [Staphylococcus intermedius]PCF88220.1 serine protease [Staphylococcus intermedius]PCF88934.1 serine protease [Staphylococcus intermedius]
MSHPFSLCTTAKAETVSLLDKETNVDQTRRAEIVLKDSPNQKKTPRYVSLKTFILSLILTALLTGCIVFGIQFYFHQYSKDHKISENAQKLSEVYEILASDFYQKQDKDQLLDEAINGMTKSLKDPYTEYLSKEETTSFHEDVSGDFVGIGAELQQKGKQIIITSPMQDSPAEKAGLKPRDVLIAIDGKSIQGQPLDAIIPKVRGKKGTEVKLTVKRNGEEKELTVTRDKIHVKSVKYEKHGDVGVFKINKFQEGSAGELKSAIQQAQKAGIKNIVLDLRNNPGGLLDEAVKMANIFLDQDETVVKLEKGDQKEAIKTSNAPLDGVKDLKVSIILNEGSASASEVFSGALHDHHVAKIYGEKSFGKGIVQTTREFEDGSLLKFTEMKWLTPNDHYIHGKGIQPDVPVKGADYENITVIPSKTTYQEGQEDQHIKSIKIGLKALGYDVGTIDNHYDAQLTSAVKQFQQKNNINANGMFNKDTNRVFTERLVEKASSEDPMLEKTLKKVEE